MANKILAWKFLKADHRLQYDDGRLLEAGVTLEDPLKLIDGKPTICESGFHGAVRARDALRYAPGPHVARVEISGEIDSEHNKLCGTIIKCLWVADATKALRLFAVRCRWAQYEHRLRGREPSIAALWALDCAERFINGDADQDELDAAYIAAYAAAYAVAAAAYAVDVAAAYAVDVAADAYAAADADADADFEETMLELEPK